MKKPTVRFVPASVMAAHSTDERADMINRLERSTGDLFLTLNDAYIPHLFRPERIQIWYGGSGSGKSDAKATELLLKCLLRPFCRVLFVRKVYNTVRMSQFQLLKDVIKRYRLAQFFEVLEGNMHIRCRHNGNMLFAGGLDDVDKLKSVTDVTDIWIEEPLDRRGSITFDDFNELNRRIRTQKASNHIHMTFNPVSRDSWIYDEFFASADYEVLALKTTYLDNHFCDEAQKRVFEILKIRKPDEYKVYALGEWGSLKQGLIFPEYQVIQYFPLELKKSGYGLDFGFYPDPTALVRCGVIENRIYMDEVVYDWELTSGKRVERMERAGVPKNAEIIADRNPEAIAEIKAMGYRNIEAAIKGPGSVEQGISMMKGYQMFITARSANLKKELDNYSWKIDPRTGKPTGEPADAWNHGIDGGRYWFMKNLNAAHKKKIFKRGVHLVER